MANIFDKAVLRIRYNTYKTRKYDGSFVDAVRLSKVAELETNDGQINKIILNWEEFGFGGIGNPKTGTSPLDQDFIIVLDGSDTPYPPSPSNADPRADSATAVHSKTDE